MPGTARKTAASKPAAPAFDFAALTVADAELPKQQSNRSGGPNPFTDVMAQSRDNGNAGKSVTVPAAQVSKVTYLIRKAATDNGVGSRIVLRDSKGANVEPKSVKSLPKTATITVLFAAKARKQRKSAQASA